MAVTINIILIIITGGLYFKYWIILEIIKNVNNKIINNLTIIKIIWIIVFLFVGILGYIIIK